MSRRMWAGVTGALVVLALMFGVGPGELREAHSQTTLTFQPVGRRA